MKALFSIILFFAFTGFSQNAVTILKTLEGSVIKSGFHVVYDDADNNTTWNGKERLESFAKRCKGTPTIGYGITDKKIIAKCKITEEEATTHLISETNSVRRSILQLVKVPLTHYQREALVCFVYNIGVGNFRKSTLLKRINENKMEEASYEISRWVYKTVKGKKVFSQGLKNRRTKEIEFFKQK